MTTPSTPQHTPGEQAAEETGFADDVREQAGETGPHASSAARGEQAAEDAGFAEQVRAQAGETDEG